MAKHEVYRLEVPSYIKEGVWVGPFSHQRDFQYDALMREIFSRTIDEQHPAPPRASYWNGPDVRTGVRCRYYLKHWFPNLDDWVKAGGRVMKYLVTSEEIFYEDLHQVVFHAINGEDVTYTD